METETGLGGQLPELDPNLVKTENVSSHIWSLSVSSVVALESWRALANITYTYAEGGRNGNSLPWSKELPHLIEYLLVHWWSTTLLFPVWSNTNSDHSPLWRDLREHEISVFFWFRPLRPSFLSFSLFPSHSRKWAPLEYYVTCQDDVSRTMSRITLFFQSEEMFQQFSFP